MNKPNTLQEWVDWAEEIDLNCNESNDFGQWNIPLDDTEGSFEKFKEVHKK